MTGRASGRAVVGRASTPKDRSAARTTPAQSLPWHGPVIAPVRRLTSSDVVESLGDAGAQIADAHVLAEAGERCVVGSDVGDAGGGRRRPANHGEPLRQVVEHDDRDLVSGQRGLRPGLERELQRGLADTDQEEVAGDALLGLDGDDPAPADDTSRRRRRGPHERQLMAFDEVVHARHTVRGRPGGDPAAGGQRAGRAVALRRRQADHAGQVVAGNRRQALVGAGGEDQPFEPHGDQRIRIEHPQRPIRVDPESEAPRSGRDAECPVGRRRVSDHYDLGLRLAERAWRGDGSGGRERWCGRQVPQRVERQTAEATRVQEPAFVEPGRKGLCDPAERSQRVPVRLPGGGVRTAGQGGAVRGRDLALPAVAVATERAARPVEAEASRDGNVAARDRGARGGRISRGSHFICDILARRSVCRYAPRGRHARTRPARRRGLWRTPPRAT